MTTTSSYLMKLLIILLAVIHTYGAVSSNKQKSVVIDDVNDIKDFKQLLRTKTNVLVCFITNSQVENSNIIKSFKEAAGIIKGHGTMVYVDCTGSAKKMCRKLKIDQTKPVSLKHYKDGEFNKDYDRRDTTSSIVTFMRDPTGSLPWDEDPTATDVIHLPDSESINRFLKKGPALMKPSMIMFYAPWCGYCKVLKPEYANAATDLKGEAYLAAIDVARPENSGIRRQYNITGFPTLLYYENGQMKYQYEGDTNRAAIVDFIHYPRPQHKITTREVPEEKDWSLTDSDVVHLTSDTFDSTLSGQNSALVLFYAPWCGHCKKIKPEYEQAAAALKTQKITCILGALDATKEPDIASRYGVKGYPTLKYFVNGEFKYDVSVREESKIVEFMKNPQAPPPPEPQWADENSNVVHLHQSDFKNILKKKKNALVMFYAPWCGHCKQTKPKFDSIAETLKDDSRTIIGAVDCTQEQALCQEYDVNGYPTIKYFSFYDKVVADYNGGRTEQDFLAYLKNPPSGSQKEKRDSDKTIKSDKPDIVQLTDATLSKEIENRHPTLVMFFAPWCGYCKKLKPVFASVAKKLRAENFPVQLAQLDCTENEKSANAYDITSYPTLLLFANGKKIEEYTGDTGENDIIKYLRKYVTGKSKEEL